MSKIEAALLEVTGQKTEKKGEDRQKYLLRLALAANNMTDKQWDSLEATEGAQDWVTAAIKADNAEKDIEDFADLEDAEAEEDAGDDAGADEEEDAAEEAEDDNPEEEDVDAKKKPAGKAAGKPTAKKGAKAAKTDTKTKAKSDSKPGKADAAPAKKAAAGKSSAAGGPKKDSMRRALKRIVVKKPKMSVDELIEQLEKKGYDAPSKVTVTTIRADTRDTMKVMNEADLADVEL